MRRLRRGFVFEPAVFEKHALAGPVEHRVAARPMESAADAAGVGGIEFNAAHPHGNLGSCVDGSGTAFFRALRHYFLL